MNETEQNEYILGRFKVSEKNKSVGIVDVSRRKNVSILVDAGVRRYTIAQNHTGSSRAQRLHAFRNSSIYAPQTHYYFPFYLRWVKCILHTKLTV